MNCTKLLPNIQNRFRKLLEERPQLAMLTQKIAHEGGTAYVVGGAVRDLLLDLPVHDMDIEVHGMPFEHLERVLRTAGEVLYVGKSFGVLKVTGIDADWSLPRKDSAGRKPIVELVPDLDIVTALKRRDLTMNAMAINTQTNELIDPFCGYEDIQAKRLRTPDPKFFVEDPLRLYRVMQFIGRFEMLPDDELNRVCATMDIQHVSIERKEAEFEKLLLKSRKLPSLGIRWLLYIKRLDEIMAELAETITTLQDPGWHPEGTVFEHTMQALDASAVLNYDSSYDKLLCMYGALCHDLGKVTTTRFIEGRLRSWGHDIAGAEPTRTLLRRITGKKQLIDSVVALVVEHMQPRLFIKQNASPRAYRKLAVKLARHEVSLSLLSKVAIADIRGRNPRAHIPLEDEVPDINEFIKRAEQAHVLYHPIAPLLHGKDIADIVSPGPQMGAALKHAYSVQINKGISDPKELKKYVEEWLKQRE